MGAARLLVLGALVASVSSCGTLAPQPSAPAAAAGADAFLLAEGDGPGGPWSYWVWRSRCGFHQRIESALAQPSIPTYPAPEHCFGARSGERLDGIVVEQSGIGDDEVSFLYGQTRRDVVRVTVRTLDGREIEVDTIAAPDDLGVSSRFYVVPIPVDLSNIDTVRGYDASGQDVGGE